MRDDELQNDDDETPDENVTDDVTEETFEAEQADFSESETEERADSHGSEPDDDEELPSSDASEDEEPDAEPVAEEPVAEFEEPELEPELESAEADLDADPDDESDEEPSDDDVPEPSDDQANEDEELTSAPEVEASEDEEAPTENPEPVISNKRWYAVKVQSGRETTIRAALERRVKIEDLEEFIGRILIPTEKQTILRKVTTRSKDGEKKTKEKRVTKEVKKYPGYLFVEVEFNDQVLFLFRETAGVGDFVGGSFNRLPTPMNDREVQRMLHEAGIKPDPDQVGHEPELTFEFEVGDRVKICDGAFKDQEGEVKRIIPPKDEKETTKVEVELSIFGRPLPVEIEPWHVEAV